MMDRESQLRYQFGPFELDTAEHTLFHRGLPVPLTPKVFDLLEILVRNRGRLVEKERLIQELWPDAFVEEGNINRNISILRKALGADPMGRRYIETVPKRGYRFIGDVRVLPPGEPRDGEGEAAAGSGSPDLHQEASMEDANAAVPYLAGRRRGAFVFLAFVLAASFFGWRQLRISETAPPEIQSLAVLPLKNLSGDPAQDPFADGMTEALIGSLAESGTLRVISRTSVMRYKGTQKLIPEIAEELQVDALLEGSVQRSGGRVMIMLQLVHGPTDDHLWVGRYDRDEADVLDLQAELAGAVAEEIRVHLSSQTRDRIGSVARVDPEAYEQYFIGRYHLWRYNEEDLKLAIERFENALQLQPDYAAAYAGLAHAWWARSIWGSVGFREAEGPARAAAAMALELDDRLAEAYVVRADLKRLYDRDWTGAERDVRRALELNPNSVDAHHTYAMLLMALGRFSEAIAQIQSAEKLDPLAPAVQSNFGRILYRARRYEEAIERLHRALELDPRHHGAWSRLGEAYTELGRYEDAMAAFEKAGEGLAGRRLQVLRSREAYTLARMGRIDEARQALADLEAEGSLPAAAASQINVALGDKDRAFELLFRALEPSEDAVHSFINVDPPFDDLRDDARWREVRLRLRLPPK